MRFSIREFDKAVGHYRRYSRRSLAKLTPESTQLVTTFYLDSIGVLASLANRVLLRSDMPSARQIQIWDRFFVPLSTLLDPLLFFRAGKSVVAVWRRD